MKNVSGFDVAFDVPPSRSCVDSTVSPSNCEAARDSFTVSQSSNERVARGELDVAFDVGTSPHGLPAELLPPDQETREGRTGLFHAKPVLNSFSANPAAAMVADAASAAQPLPPCASQLEFQGARFVRYVPVAFAARDWKVSPRRIRALLAAARLEGRREANGYWEVAYPYRFTFGQRGPALKRTQKQERSTA